MERTTICGQVFVLGAQGDNVVEPLLSSAIDLVLLKMVKDVESMERTIKLQLKLTPRRANLAIRTRVLIFYSDILVKTNDNCELKGHEPSLVPAPCP